MMVYSHWLSPGPGQGPGYRGMGCMVLFRTFHTALEQGQGSTPIVPIFLALVPAPVLVPGTAYVITL